RRSAEGGAPAGANQELLVRTPGQTDLRIGSVARIRITVVTNGRAQIERLHQRYALRLRHDRHEDLGEGGFHLAHALGEARSLIVAGQVERVLRLQIQLVAGEL